MNIDNDVRLNGKNDERIVILKQQFKKLLRLWEQHEFIEFLCFSFSN